MSQESEKAILATLGNMPIWNQMGIGISHMENDYLQFQKGNIYIMIPTVEILILGAERVRRMFAQLDN